ncbi:MAG: hypothetical protein ACPGTQ_14255, partial [Colwellia sp.]
GLKVKLFTLVGLNLFGKLLVFVFVKKKIREQVLSYNRYLPKRVFTTEVTEALRYTEEIRYNVSSFLGERRSLSVASVVIILLRLKAKEIAAKARSYKSDLFRWWLLL